MAKKTPEQLKRQARNLHLKLKRAAEATSLVAAQHEEAARAAEELARDLHAEPAESPFDCTESVQAREPYPEPAPAPDKRPWWQRLFSS